jgi:transcriptional regulator with XRE-family HTH domain
MEIGDQLRKVRRYRGYSLQALAQKTGVSKSTLHAWETGTVEPRVGNLKKVLDALGLTYEQLYQDFDAVFVREALEKFETDHKDIEVVLTADPALSPADVDIIMRIVLSKEAELADKEKDEKS